MYDKLKNVCKNSLILMVEVSMFDRILTPLPRGLGFVQRSLEVGASRAWFSGQRGRARADALGSLGRRPSPRVPKPLSAGCTARSGKL